MTTSSNIFNLDQLEYAAGKIATVKPRLYISACKSRPEFKMVSVLERPEHRDLADVLVKILDRNPQTLSNRDLCRGLFLVTDYILEVAG